MITVQRRIVGFQLDEVGDWVAQLTCGHGQHVRHEPPLTNRPWVLTEEGRQNFIGFELNCVLCDAEQQCDKEQASEKRESP